MKTERNKRNGGKVIVIQLFLYVSVAVAQHWTSINKDLHTEFEDTCNQYMCKMVKNCSSVRARNGRRHKNNYRNSTAGSL